MKAGVYQATKKDGSKYYRSSITFHGKHISLGSFDTETKANKAYQVATTLVNSKHSYQPEDYSPNKFPILSFKKWITLINFKNNGIYIKTPIYLRKNYFQYYLSPNTALLFDVDDLFYYSNHSIMKRGSHLFVAEYGMQTNIHSRYGIRNFARLGVDYAFVNGNPQDYRYSNIKVINPYHGVTVKTQGANTIYTAKIHLRGDFIIGHFDSLAEAAIAYNKARDYATTAGFHKNFPENYIEDFPASRYATIYQQIEIPENIISFFDNKNA